jgi:ribose 5-phosphate isomerase B
MTLIIASDHAGFQQKQVLIEALEKKGLTMIDGGTFSEGSCHYPEYALSAAERVVNQEAPFGILICGSGIGVSIAANKVKGARCAVGYHDEAVKRARIDNNANLIAFGARYMTLEDMIRRIQIFIETAYEGGRHQTRLDIIQDYENKHYKG